MRPQGIPDAGSQASLRLLGLAEHRLDGIRIGTVRRGETFGVKIKELSLLCRAVFVADKSGKLTHVEYVSEATNEPDYDAAMQAVSVAL